MEQFATIGQLEARLTEIEDALLRKTLGETSDASIGSEQESTLRAEADCIRRVLAAELGKRTGMGPEAVLEARATARGMHELAQRIEWAIQHKRFNSEADATIKNAFADLQNGTKTQDQVVAELTSLLMPIIQPDNLENLASPAVTKARKWLIWSVLTLLAVAALLVLVAKL